MEITRFDDKCVIVNIPIGILLTRRSLYSATRRCWRMSLKKAKDAKYLLGIAGGEVKCVIEITNCAYVKPEFCAKESFSCKKYFHVNTKCCEKKPRVIFEGNEQKNDQKYFGKSIPAEYMPRQNPVRYTY